MKTIPLAQAFEIISNASAIIINVDSNPVVYPSLYELGGDESNEFLYLEWEQEYLEYSLKFRQEDNQSVKVEGASIYLLDTDADSDEDATRITILAEKDLESLL